MEEAAVNRQSIIDWFNFCRYECTNWIHLSPIEFSGFEEGLPVVVKIVENIFLDGKYHRGRLNDGHWVFGAIERNSKRCILLEVDDCTAEMLEEVISEHILGYPHRIEWLARLLWGCQDRKMFTSFCSTCNHEQAQDVYIILFHLPL